MVSVARESPAVRAGDSGVPLIPHGFVARSRLSSRLDATHDVPLVVVRGAGGSGKSGLIASWLRERAAHADVPHHDLWVSLDDGTRSRASFWRRIVGALQAIGTVTPESPLSGFILGYADLDDVPGLVLAQLEHDRVPTRLILDDFHLVDDSNANDVVWLLKQSRWLTVIVTTRRTGSFESADVGARVNSLVITENDLAFTERETRELLASTTRFSTEHAAVVFAATNGHPLATRIAVTLLTQRPHTVSASVAQAQDLSRQLADHIAHTLLPAFADDNDLLFAAIVALPPESTVALAHSLSGRGHDDVQLLLTSFANEGLGEFRLTETELAFRFHPLVAEALRRHAERTLSAHDVQRARLTSADALSGAGNGLEALKLYIGAGEHERIWPTVAQHFSELINYQQDELHALLSSLPIDILKRHGTAAISLAIVMSERERMPSARLRQLVTLGIDDIDSRAIPPNSTQVLLLSLARFAGFRAARRYEEAADEGDTFVSHVEAVMSGGFARTNHAIGAGLIQIVITNVLLGRWHRATAVAHLMSSDDHEGRSQHRESLLAYIAAFTGHMVEAESHLGEITHVDRLGWRTSVPATGWHIATALGALESGNHDEALSTISVLSLRLNRLEHWAFVVWTRAQIRLATGEAQIALDELDSSVKQHKFRPLSDAARALLQSMKSDLHLAIGQRERALSELANMPASATLAVSMLSRARALLANNDLAAASGLLDIDRVRDTGTVREFAQALLLRAVIEARLGYESRSLTTMRRAANVMSNHGLTTPAIMVPQAELRDIAARHAPELLTLFTRHADPFTAVSLTNPLTPREREVLATLARSTSLDDVATALFVSVNTIKSQLRSAYRKLGVASGSDAIRLATDKGFLESR
ncbi:LuxR C-terminal-related transcriptional regulator [Salinibacterium sp. M195]|uniref:LuxR C-terminal-related transcriptional regulator n=1 Tax=Salinibacterium sp. M195 TaxID=2583374 RepID=UPI001C625F05|nr:LuxR C-terminal-related transcriptional regulator [Salinibacterium sp. M195]QYH35582.1 hypothetical protein FFT87_06230 [Salinibacterium sp. M195]